MLKAKVFSNKYNLLLFLLIAVVSLFIQYVIILKTSESSIYVLVGLNLILLLVILYNGYIQNIAAFLLIINFLPLLYLNNDFHYDFSNEILSTIPLFLIFLISVANFISSEKSFSFSITYLQLPIVLFVAYFFIWGMINILIGGNSLPVSYQLFQIFLYLMIFPIMYLIKDREKYKLVFSFLLILVVIMAFEYILINRIIYSTRYVTFQSGFFPVAASIVLAYILFKRNHVKKLFAGLLLTLIILGAAVTLTRGLWVAIFLAVLFTIIIYLLSQKKLNFTRIIILTFFLLIPILIVRDESQNLGYSAQSSSIVEYRTKSVTNPLEDSSFLMRVEFGYYAIQRFLESPVFGKGLGDYLKYKFFPVNNAPNYYMDSNWLYLLWKGGLVGFLLFLWLYIRFLKTAYFNIKNSPDVTTKLLNLGLVAGFLSLAFLGLISPLLIKYKTNALIAFCFAYVEFERIQIADDNKTEIRLT